ENGGAHGRVLVGPSGGQPRVVGLALMPHIAAIARRPGDADAPEGVARLLQCRECAVVITAAVSQAVAFPGIAQGRYQHDVGWAGRATDRLLYAIGAFAHGAVGIPGVEG